MDVARQLEYYTIDDIYNLPDGQRAELIDGELYMMATPSMIHQRGRKESVKFSLHHLQYF